MLHKDRRKRPGYNVQSVVDEKEGMVTSIEPTVDAADSHQLQRQVENSSANIGHYPDHALADCGYHRADEFAALERKGVKVISPSQKVASNSPDNPFAVCNFEYDRVRDQFTCPAGKRLVYIRTEKRGKKRGKRAKYNRVYRCRDCKDCPLRSQCTKDKSGRSVRRQVNADARQRVLKRVASEAGKELFKRRKIVEHSFSTIKWRLGITRLSHWTRQGNAAFLALTAVAMNMERSLTLLSRNKEDANQRLRIAVRNALREMPIQPPEPSKRGTSKPFSRVWRAICGQFANSHTYVDKNSLRMAAYS